MKIKFIIFILINSLLVIFSAQTFASSVGMGGVATHILEPVSVVSDFVHSGSLVLGIAFLFATVVKFFEHRRSPLMVPISTVIFLFILGLVLVFLPLLAYVNANGIHFSLLGK